MALKYHPVLSVISHSLRRLLYASCIAVCLPIGIFAGNMRSVEILEQGSFRSTVHTFAAAGGENVASGGGLKVVSSLGVSGVTKMKGGTYEMGTGIVGSGAVAVANLDRAHAFPNPFMPSRGHTWIKFSQLTKKCIIRIYTLAGELVKELTKDAAATDRFEWYPVHNKQGQDLASGVFIWYIESSEGQVKTGKLMVIK